MSTDTRILAIALPLVKEIRARQERQRAEWEREAEECRKDGFRPQYCLHGTNQWGEYDSLCYWCETYGAHGLPSPYELALEKTHEIIRREDEIVGALVTLGKYQVIVAEESAAIWGRTRDLR